MILTKNEWTKCQLLWTNPNLNLIMNLLRLLLMNVPNKLISSPRTKLLKEAKLRQVIFVVNKNTSDENSGTTITSRVGFFKRLGRTPALSKFMTSSIKILLPSQIYCPIYYFDMYKILWPSQNKYFRSAKLQF